MLFKFNYLTYEVPEKAGVSIKVEVDTEHADYNFVDECGEDIPKLGGTDEHGRPVKSWEDYGIKQVGDDRAVADAQKNSMDVGKGTMQFTYGDPVQHISDPHGRSRGVVVRQADEHGIMKVKWFGVGESDDWEEPVHETELRLRYKAEDAACRTDGVGEVVRLLGFALFNLNKGNASAAETLMRKAYKALSGREWDSA